MVSLNPFKWLKKNNSPSEMEYAVGNALSVAEQGKSTSEVEREKQLAENGIIMVDPELDRLITGLGAYARPEVNSLTGEVIYEEVEIEEEGRTQRVKRPKMETGFITKYVALRVLSSRLIRSSYLDPQDVMLAKIRMRCILRRIKMKMTESDYEKGGSLLIDSIMQILDNNLSCAKNGRMALVMKSSPRSMEVRVGKAPDQKS